MSNEVESVLDWVWFLTRGVESEKASWLSVLNWTLPMEVFVSSADLLNEITLMYSLCTNDSNIKYFILVCKSHKFTQQMVYTKLQ